jgi:hypothetical protein
MLTQILIRVIVGGIIVSIFAVLSDTLKPKSFAGLFGAAPSVALATIVLAVAKEYGPSVGGLFLAFPAIFPASATLIEQHEKRRKQRTGGHGTLRGRRAAALDAAGASIGAFRLLIRMSGLETDARSLTVATLSIATLGWLAISMLGWKLWHIF